MSVKSAYVIAKEILGQRRGGPEGRGQTSGEQENDGKWKRIWHIKTPMKVRSFIWKCLHNIVPLNVNLFQRKMPVDRMCPKCGDEPESVDHMLFHCEQAVRVWLLSQTGGNADSKI